MPEDGVPLQQPPSKPKPSIHDRVRKGFVSKFSYVDPSDIGTSPGAWFPPAVGPSNAFDGLNVMMPPGVMPPPPAAMTQPYAGQNGSAGLNALEMTEQLMDSSRKGKGKKGKGKGKAEEGKAKGKGKRPIGVPEEVPRKYSTDFWEEPREMNNLDLIGELARDAGTTNNWNYVVKDDSRRSYCAFLKCPYTPEHCQMFFNAVNQGTNWMQPEGKQGPIPRKTAWLVSQGCTCTYRYGSTEVEHEVFPQWMIDLMGSVMPLCGLKDRRDWPNSCNLNLYENGSMSVGWHSDDERLFQGKFQDIRIVSLSLGTARTFELRSNWPQEDERQSIWKLNLGNGDLCTMEGMMQKYFQHRVPKEGHRDGQRINLTWRWVVKHTPQCPASRMRR